MRMEPITRNGVVVGDIHRAPAVLDPAHRANGRRGRVVWHARTAYSNGRRYRATFATKSAAVAWVIENG